MPHPHRRLGKRPAVRDHRIPPMKLRMRSAMLPPPPLSANWYADLPDNGIPMLANDRISCCVEASVCHYLQVMSLYCTPKSPLIPTEAECIKIYSDVTGYNPAKPASDQGTYFLGKGGMVDHWWNNGVVVGGKLNRPTAVAQIDFTDRNALKLAIATMGFIFVGATMRADDMQSDFMFSPGSSPVEGGHEFIICGYETVASLTFYDILTWGGMFRCTDDWITQSVDEAAIVFNQSFFDVRMIDPAGISWTELANDMAKLIA